MEESIPSFGQEVLSKLGCALSSQNNGLAFLVGWYRKAEHVQLCIVHGGGV